MAPNIKIALVQADLIWENIAANLEKFDSLLTQVDSDTDVVILPEMFTTGFSMNCDQLAEEMSGNSLSWIRRKANDLDVALIGSLIIRESDSYFNRMIWMNPNGSHSTYDKKYLFTPSGEHLKYDAGTQRIIVEFKGWRFCPLICYDLRFPEWSRNTDFYDVLIYAANWPDSRSDHWISLLKARAIENQCYCIGVNRVGKDGVGLKYQGDTSAYSFDGSLLVESKHDETIDHIEISKEKLDVYRNKLPFLNDQL